MFKWYCNFRLHNSKFKFCSTSDSLNLYPIEKYQSVYQVKTHKDLIFRIKYKKKLKKIKIFETRKNLDRFLEYS